MSRGEVTINSGDTLLDFELSKVSPESIYAIDGSNKRHYLKKEYVSNIKEKLHIRFDG